MKIQAVSHAFSSTVAAAAQVQSSPRTRHTAAEIEPLLAKIAVYDYGADPDPVVSFAELVEDLQGSAAQRKALEVRLLRFLQSSATAAGKEIALRQLAQIGTDASIPVLAPLLALAETAEIARYALAAIPGAAADEALRNSLGRAPDERSKIGIVNSLGNRKDTRAAPALAALISPSNPEITAAAVAALANIADRVAVDALAAARSKAAGQVRDLITEAYVVSADRLVEKGDSAAATNIYKAVLAQAAEPRLIRTRALAGLTTVNPQAAVPALTAEIQSKDPEAQAAAIKLLNSVPGPEITKVMVGAFPKLPPYGQVQLLTAMAQRGDTAAKPTILAALKSNAPGVQAAALAGLGKLGDESSVTLLAEAAALGQGAEQSAARRSLYTLRGPGIDGALISAMGASGRVKIELITAAGERGATSAADALTKAAQEVDPDVRREALRALRNVGGAAQTTALLALLLKASAATERREATQTLATVLKRAQPAPLGEVTSAYKSASDLNSRLSLLEVMGQTSSPEALPLLRAGIKDANPEIARGAILALTAWDDSTPLMDLLSFAKTVPRNLEAPKGAEPTGPAGAGRGGRGAQPTSNLLVLALRGVLRLILLQPQRPTSQSGRLLAEAMGLASQRAEKVAILSLLPSFPSQESLEVARAAQGDAQVANEAKIALDQVAEALKLE